MQSGRSAATSNARVGVGEGPPPRPPAASTSTWSAPSRDVGLADEAERVRVPRHRAGPLETLSDVDFANLLRVPDRREVIGKRDVALLRVLGDCGLTRRDGTPRRDNAVRASALVVSPVSLVSIMLRALCRCRSSEMGWPPASRRRGR